MRTQLILTTAILGVAGSLGASAQVYSVNAVGYINATVPAGKLALIANQLNTGGNKISEVIPTAGAGGVIAFTYVAGTGFVGNANEFGDAWDLPNQVIAPGSAFFVQNNGAANLTITFVGEVPQGNLSNPLVAGLNLVSSQVPQSGKLVADLKFPVAEGDSVYQWDMAGQTYKSANSFELGEWGLGDPTIAVGEGFFVQKAAAVAWARSFSVN